jgi:hypothetical protein
MAVLQLRTYLDLVSAVREELGIQSSDTTAINRIKRDINMVYQEVVSEENWWWLAGSKDLVFPAYINSGTASVTPNSATITLSVAPTASQVGRKFSVDSYSEIYTIESHTAGSSTLKLTSEYTGTINTVAPYKIWSDRIPLPIDLKETTKVWHDHTSKPMDGLGIQEFRRLSTLNPRAENRPLYYTTTDFVDPRPTSTITSLPFLLTRASAGVVKTLVFGATLPTSILTSSSNGDPIRVRISKAGDPTYNGDYLVAGISTTNVTNDTLIFIAPALLTEVAVSDSTLLVEQLDQESNYERYRELLVHPSLYNSRMTIHVEFVKEILPLLNDNDEPVIPIEDRLILVYGTLHRSWSKMRNPEEAQRNFGLYGSKLAKMQGKMQDSVEMPRLEISKSYLSGKKSIRRTRNLNNTIGLGIGGGNSQTQVTGLANSAATFDATGTLVGSSTISTTELGYLDNSTSNIQNQLDGKLSNVLTNGKVLIGNDSSVATEQTLSGDITTTNSGVVTIANSVITNAKVSASAAISKSKLATGTASKVEVTDSSGNLVESTTTTTELTYLADNEPLTSAALADNSSGTIASWAYANYDSVSIRYSIKRGTANRATGTIHLCTDGTSVGIAQSESSIGTHGITLSASISGANLLLNYLSTSTGTSGTLKYKVQKNQA